MSEFVCLTIPGEPQGKGRPRYSRLNGQVFTPHETRQYEALIVSIYRQKYGDEIVFGASDALDIRIKAYYGLPKSDSAKQRMRKLTGELRPTKKPDWDNVGKIVADALNKVAYHDDSQIVDSQFRKFYSDTPRVEIIINKAGGKINDTDT